MTSANAERIGKWRRLLRWAERAFAIAGVYFVVYHSCFSLDVITSPSMSPTLQGESFRTGDWVLSERVTGWFHLPRRWNIVRFHDAEGMLVMKRVIAFAGETIALQKKEVLINGAPIPRPASLDHLSYYSYGNLERGKSFQVEKGFYVLGDNSRDSQDSRFEGPILPEQIDGRPWLVIWPLAHLRFVNP
jgi:signal peptidase I